ncbi:nicotinate-nucleotide adenylyltransferase [Rubinisphaera margarita]|uniref:nicotinate-nucleotide adenylyltransferase n=1 Tax=Rubinisphaera margarita TaxID=2909586 RepID=UPI001EE81F4D|nr:nicotinate-nucleotide adenylyltransferase [Rubinisphaera margarita]MCG6158494.1 nicotinate-nucleotide adenylyltransferase [Rubinisphaera margarita]
MRMGILGGTFDPVHFAHLILAETCREACQLDQVRFVPNHCSPHKQDDQPTSAKQRQAMLELAAAGIPEFVVDPRELKKAEVCYTVDTLAEMKSEFPDAELFFLIGADSLRDFPTWRQPERIAELATIVAVNRGNTPEGELQAMLDGLPEPLRERVQLVEMPGIGISATALRERVQQNLSIRFLTPRPVERYILENGLYRAN